MSNSSVEYEYLPIYISFWEEYRKRQRMRFDKNTPFYSTEQLKEWARNNWPDGIGPLPVMFRARK